MGLGRAPSDMKRIQWTCAGMLCAALALTLCVEAQDNPLPNPVFPFGAVYFRKSNPPEQDWDRDHKAAAQMGVNIFRHWFMWADRKSTRLNSSHLGISY